MRAVCYCTSSLIGSSVPISRLAWVMEISIVSLVIELFKYRIDNTVLIDRQIGYDEPALFEKPGTVENRMVFGLGNNNMIALVCFARAIPLSAVLFASTPQEVKMILTV